MVAIRAEIASDIPAREALLNKGFGGAAKRLRKTSEKLRRDRLPSEGLAFTAVTARGRVVGTVRLWDIIAGSAGPALLLGPLAVDDSFQGKGLGSALMVHALQAAREMGHSAVILVGDEAYYQRFGFSAEHTKGLHLPGPVERERFLGLELTEEALDDAEGLIAACGRMVEADRLAA
jgi:predicted N-acetyltransferase YhbS